MQDDKAIVSPKVTPNVPATTCRGMNATRTARPLQPADWVSRCIERLQTADPELSADEAAGVARQLFAFERTGAMPPEVAVDFVLSQYSTSHPRFERRSPNRLSTIRARS